MFEKKCKTLIFSLNIKIVKILIFVSNSNEFNNFLIDHSKKLGM